MKLIGSMNGDGWLQVGAAAPAPTRYVIGVWEDPTGIVFGRGHISGAVDTMCRAALQGGPIPLVLGNGQAIAVIVTDRGIGNDWGEIYVPDPVPVETAAAAAA